MKEIVVFDNPKFGQIRTVERDGEPWFCMADVCRPLGLRTTPVKARLKEGGVITIDTADSLGRPNQLSFMNEANLYRAIFQSKKPEAEAFTDWVTEDVLPTLRKRGEYSIPERAPEVSLSGLANLIRITRRVMLDMGSTPQEIGHMVKDLFNTWNVPVPVSLEKQIPGQLNISDIPRPLLDG